jgi:hypothetical protein
MRTGLNIVGGLLVLIGAIWALQGLNLLGGSFMTGQTQWLVIGVLAAIVGFGLLGWANRRRG